MTVLTIKLYTAARKYACYLHSTGGTLGEGTACDDGDDDDDCRDLCTS